MSIAVKYDADELGSSLEVSIIPDDPEGSKTHTLEVKAGAAMVVALVGGRDGTRGMPSSVEIEIRNPREERVTTLNLNEQVFADPEAQEGPWSIRVIVVGREPSAEVHAATISPKLLRDSARRPGWFRCETCKALLKALVIALLFYISQWAVVAKAFGALAPYIGKHAPKLATVLAILIPKELREKLLDLLKEYVNEPIKRLLQRICHFLRMCPVLQEAV